MQEIYENIAENISSNPPFIRLMDWCRRVDSITIVGFGNGLSTLVALSTKPKTITVYDHVLPDGIADYQTIANDHGVQFVFHNKMIVELDAIPQCDMLIVDTFAEGNVVMTICQKFEKFVNRYIVVNNTFKHAHQPDPTVKLGNNAQPVGVVFGLNSFLQNNDPWHIAENMYWSPGLTLLYRRKDLTDNGTSN
jgi:hypothetical protein